MGRRRESTPLRICEIQAPAAHVLFEDAVLFPQIGNHLKLAAIHPPGEGDEQNLPSDRVEHPPSLPATAALTIRARLNFRIVRACVRYRRPGSAGERLEGARHTPRAEP